jgi:hypothetical protein
MDNYCLYLNQENGFKLHTIQKVGVHLNNGSPLRKNFAGKNWTYDKTKDAFIPPKPENNGVVFNSWILNEETCLWEAPVAKPNDESEIRRYTWNEETISWDLVEE